MDQAEWDYVSFASHSDQSEATRAMNAIADRLRLPRVWPVSKPPVTIPGVQKLWLAAHPGVVNEWRSAGPRVTPKPKKESAAGRKKATGTARPKAGA